VFDEFNSHQRTKCIIKHYEQASFSNMEVRVFHSHAYPLAPLKWHHKLLNKKHWLINFHHLSLYFLFFFFIFPSLWNFYFFFFYSLFFYFLFQPMWILTDLSLCHKFQLHFMSLMPQIKGTFIKIECFKMKPCSSQKKMTRVHGTIFHTLSCTEFDPRLIHVKACW